MMVFLSCKTTREEYSSDRFIVVKVISGDTFKSLAAKYLKDPEKDWIITEFNKTDFLKPGSSIIIPLSSFNKGGLKANGYQIVPVLNYKDFSIEIEKTKQTVTLSEFKEQLGFLSDNGFRVITVKDLLAYIDYQIQIPEKSVVLTFSGDINSFYDIAMPVIEARKYASTLFIDPLKIENKTLWKRIEELSKRGVGIHLKAGLESDFIENNNGTLKDYFFNIEKIIIQSKKKIERHIKTKCTLYSSTGNNNSILCNILMTNGYKAAFFDSQGENPFFVDKFEINMSVIPSGLKLDDFKKKTKTFQKMDLN